VNFKYESNFFGPGPLLSTSNVKYIVDDDGTWTVKNDQNGNDLLISKRFTEDQDDICYPNQFGEQIDDWTSQYISAQTASVENPSGLQAVRSIPILIRPNNVNFKYYNPTKEKIFIPNEWYIHDLQEVNNQVNKSNAWKNLNKKTGQDSHATTLGYNVNLSSSNASYDSVNLQSIFPKFGDADITIKDLDGNNQTASIEYAIKSLYVDWNNSIGSSIQYKNINSSDFIAFADYAPYTPKGDFDDKINLPIGDGVSYGRKVPIFRSIEMDSVFPVWLLFNIDDNGEVVFDYSLFSSDQIKNVEGISTFPYSPKGKMVDDQFENVIAYLDKSKLLKKYNKFTNFLSKIIDNESLPQDGQEEKYFSYIFQMLLGDFLTNQTTDLDISNKIIPLINDDNN
ncbi:MAG: hypothetical protein LBD05_01560, partial [Mycoplasmataceae bacterium]|nr:hypothetical protein [Mycoplasmataceae bacterium]